MLQLGLWAGISSWVLPKDSAQGFIVPSELLFSSLLIRCMDLGGIYSTHTVLSFQELWIRTTQ